MKKGVHKNSIQERIGNRGPALARPRAHRTNSHILKAKSPHSGSSSKPGRISKLSSSTSSKRATTHQDVLMKEKIANNTYLFINDREHHHIFLHTREDDAQRNQPMQFQDIFRPSSTSSVPRSVSHRYVSAAQQSKLNNEYDFAITQMLNSFLRSDKVRALKKRPEE